jgi:threonylcarbamoyladenosine tRNA methylthiotransferase MtaB
VCNEYFSVLTLGCKLNQLESEAVADAFTQAGFEQLTANNEQSRENGAKNSPAVVVVNTCTVTSKADQKARRVICKALRDNPDSAVLVTGCYAQLNRGDLLKLDAGTKRRLFVIEKDNVLNLIHLLGARHCVLDTLSTFRARHSAPDNSSALDTQFSFNPERFSRHTRSFLKIQDGCNNHCSYCRIRLARGPGISLDAQEALSRLRILEKNHAEAVLTGVNICQYKEQLTINGENAAGMGLAELLEYLLGGTENIKLRLSSLEPDFIDEKLVKILANKRIRPHFHLSIQSGSEKILKKMGRSYNNDTIEKAVNLLRSAKDDPFLACDIIAGFPGETGTEFDETLSMCKKLDFAWIHVFPYSKRPGTPAWHFNGTVRESDVSQRVQILGGLSAHGRERYVKRWLGREVEAMAESGTARGSKTERGCRGISENYLKLLIRHQGGNVPAPGTVLRCELLEAGNFKDYDAKAAVVPKLN